MNKWVDFATMAWPEKANARLAQLVEHSTDTRKVLGSNPRARTNLTIHYKWCILLLLSTDS